MTADEVRRELGLIPAEKYRKKHGLGPCDRRAGRTTEVLLEAVAAMSEGERVALVARTTEEARGLGNILRNMASRVGADPRRLEISTSYAIAPERLRGFSGKTFFDHYISPPL